MMNNKRGIITGAVFGAVTILIILIVLLTISSDVVTDLRSEQTGYTRTQATAGINTSINGPGHVIVLTDFPTTSIISVINESTAGHTTLTEGTGPTRHYTIQLDNHSITLNLTAIGSSPNGVTHTINTTYEQAGAGYNSSTNGLEGVSNFSARFGTLGTVLAAALIIGAIIMFGRQII